MNSEYIALNKVIDKLNSDITMLEGVNLYGANYNKLKNFTIHH